MKNGEACCKNHLYKWRPSFVKLIKLLKFIHRKRPLACENKATTIQGWNCLLSLSWMSWRSFLEICWDIVLHCHSRIYQWIHIRQRLTSSYDRLLDSALTSRDICFKPPLGSLKPLVVLFVYGVHEISTTYSGATRALFGRYSGAIRICAKS